MATRILHPEWRASHEPTKFPFSDQATLVNSNGDFVPESVFLDATFYPIGGRERAYLSAVQITHQAATLVLGDTGTANRAVGEFDLFDPPDEVEFVDAFDRPAGMIVSESLRLAVFQAWSVGTHQFTVTETEFAATCCIPTPEIGLRGFILEDGSVFADDIWLVGDDGVVLSMEEVTHTQANCAVAGDPQKVIRIDIVGDPLFRRRLCAGLFTTPNFLRQITVQNGCRRIVCGPDELGDFKFTVGNTSAEDTILRIRTVNNSLVIETVGERLASQLGSDR